MQLHNDFCYLKAQLNTVIIMPERMAVKVTFASDVRKFDCDGWF